MYKIIGVGINPPQNIMIETNNINTNNILVQIKNENGTETNGYKISIKQ